MKPTSPRITLRIPGDWADPGELLERLPEGFRLTHEALCLPDGSRMEFVPMPPDDKFAGVFKSSCRRPPRDKELAILDRYRVIVALTGPGGSMSSARAMMSAGAAIVRAGGAGVFIDNCALAHGGEDWLDMTGDGSPDAVSFAFAAIVRGQHEVWTMGMHIMGFPDLVMRKADLDEAGDTIIEIIRYVCQAVKPFGEGHVIADLHGPRFQAQKSTHDEFPQTSVMHNPFGRLKLVSMKDLAEGN